MRVKPSIFAKGLILVAVPLLFQLLLIGLIASNESKMTEARRWYAHTKEVLQQTDSILASILEAQTGCRGYIISGNPLFIEPYRRAERDLPPALRQLKDLVSDNPEQTTRAREIEDEINGLLRWQATNVRLVAAGEREKAAERVVSLGGKNQMDKLRGSLNAFRQTERTLDDGRSLQLDAMRNRLPGILIAGTAASILIMFFLLAVFTRSISSRLAVLSNNARSLAQGKDQFETVAGHDEIAQLDRVFRQAARDLAAAHAAVDNQSRLLQSVLDSMGEGVVVADEQGKFLIFNPAAERMLGVGPIAGPASEWSTLYRVFMTDRKTPYPARDLPLARAMRGEAIDAVEIYVCPPNASEGRWLDVTGRPLTSPDGRGSGGVVVFRDTTQAKEAEEALCNLNEELEQRIDERTADLAETNRDLAQTNQENETFVYSVSHDLRSPLVNLQGFSQELTSLCDEIRDILSQPEVPARLRDRGLALLNEGMSESIRYIQSGVMRLSKIIDALLRLSRVGRVEYQRQAVDVQAIVEAVVTSMAGTIDERGAQIKVGSLPTACGDATAIEQVFANLIGNALNYLDPARLGAIEIGFRETGASFESGTACHTYYVRDNGLGIPEAYQPKLFQAFQRLHPEVAKGEGMGLAMVRRIVERHGGKIWVESNEEFGSIFFVSLPAGEATGPASPAFGFLHNERGQKDERRTVSYSVGGR